MKKIKYPLSKDWLLQDFSDQNLMVSNSSLQFLIRILNNKDFLEKPNNLDKIKHDLEFGDGPYATKLKIYIDSSPAAIKNCNNYNYRADDFWDTKSFSLFTYLSRGRSDQYKKTINQINYNVISGWHLDLARGRYNYITYTTIHNNICYQIQTNIYLNESYCDFIDNLAAHGFQNIEECEKAINSQVDILDITFKR